MWLSRILQQNMHEKSSIPILESLIFIPIFNYKEEVLAIIQINPHSINHTIN